MPAGQERRQVRSRARFEDGARRGTLKTDQGLQVVRVAKVDPFVVGDQGPADQRLGVDEVVQDAFDVVEGQQAFQFLGGSWSVELQHLGRLANRVFAEDDLGVDDEGAACEQALVDGTWDGRSGEPLGGGDCHAFLHPFGQFGGVVGNVTGSGALCPRLEVGNHLRCQLRPKRLIKDGLADQVVGQRGWAGAFGRIVRIHVAADLVEGDAGSEWTWRRDRRHGPVEFAADETFEYVESRFEVELVLEACSPRLEHDGEVGERLRGRQQFLGLQTGHPQRHAALETAFGQEQRPPRAFAKPCAEEIRALERCAEQRLEVGRRHQAQEQGGIDVVLDLDNDGVVVRVDVCLSGESRPPSGLKGECDGAVDAAAPHRMQDDLLLAVGTGVAPGTGFHVLDEKVVHVRQVTVGGVKLALQVLDQLVRCDVVESSGLELMEEVVALPFQRLVRELQELADPAREMETPVEVVRTPEGRRGALRGRGLHQHVVVGDPVDAPVLGA